MPFGVIKGVVRDEDGHGLTYAHVAVIGERLAAMSDYNAAFAIHFVPPGIYKLKTYMMGYTPQATDSVNVQMGRITEIIIEMKVETTPVTWE